LCYLRLSTLFWLAQVIGEGVRVGISTNRINGVFATGLCTVVVAACSGGGGSSISTSPIRPQSRSPVFTAQSTKAAKGNVTFTIGIKPRTQAGRITPQYVSPSSQSLQILTDGAKPVVVNFEPGADCSPNPAAPGAYICIASFNVLPGDHVFTVTTYDLFGAKGNVLSTNSTGVVSVKPTGTTSVPIVLEGVVKNVRLILATLNPRIGQPAKIGLSATLDDADGNLIVGPALFKYPVTLTTTDAVNGPLSQSILRSPANASGILVNYSGAKVASVTYSATATDLPASNVLSAVLEPGAPTRHLFVVYAGYHSGVNVFNLSNPSSEPTKIVPVGYFSPQGAAISASGKLYVANYGAGTVNVFDTAHGNAALPTITSPGLNGPSGVAVDVSGKLYVTNDLFPGSVSVFDTARGNAVLSAITGGGLSEPLGAAIDASGKLYVSNSDGSVSIFDTAHDNAVLPGIPGGRGGDGAAVDANGRLYVVYFGGSIVSVFDTAHGNTVQPAITGGGLNNPTAVAVDASGKLYVTNWGGNSVSVFDTAHGNAVLPVITGGGLNAPTGVAVH
jgi:YVTN family beta-propeller protein